MKQRRQTASGPARVLHLVRGGDHVDGIFRDGQLPAVAIEDATALARDRDRLGVLTLRVGAQPSSLDPLHPRCAADRDQQQQQETGEQQAYAPLDHLALKSIVRARRSMNRLSWASRSSQLFALGAA